MMRLPLSLICLTLLGGPLLAQGVPDGPAFGGTRVFAEGISSLANPARFDLSRPGCLTLPGLYAGYVDGGQEAVDFRKALDRLGLSEAAQIGEGLNHLSRNGWGLKTRGYGVSFLADSGLLGLSREETTSLWAVPDTLPAHLGSTGNLAQNTSVLEVRRTVVERAVFGLSATEQGRTYGLSLRAERWHWGRQDFAANPLPGKPGLLGPGVDFYGVTKTEQTTTTATLDAGYVQELAQGVRMGLMVDRLVAKRLWDVEEKPQVRAGLQIDFGTMAKLSVESDLNEAKRMPFPVNQRSLAASLTLVANPSVSIQVGAERRKVGESSVTRGSAFVRFHMPGLIVGGGLQFGQDKPLRGVVVSVP